MKNIVKIIPVLVILSSLIATLVTDFRNFAWKLEHKQWMYWYKHWRQIGINVHNLKDNLHV